MRPPGLLRGGALRAVDAFALVPAGLQLFLFAYPYNPTIPREYFTTPPRLAQLAYKTPGECFYTFDELEIHRLMPGERGWSRDPTLAFYWHEREALRPNRRLLHDVRASGVWYALTPVRMCRLWTLLESSLKGEVDPATGLQIARPASVVRAIGAGYLVTRNRALLPGVTWAEDFGDFVALRVADAVPPAYFARGARVCATPEAALGEMCEAGFDPLVPVVETQSPLPSAGSEEGAQVLSVDQDRGHTRIRCRSRRAALLVVRETYDDHFGCLVDGQPQPMLRANYLHRAVAVPAGEHEVEFVYDAWDLRLGAAVSLCTLAALTFALVLPWAVRRRRAGASPVPLLTKETAP